MNRVCVFVLVATLLAACAPDSKGPIDSVVLGLEAGQGFALHTRTLDTIDSVAQGRGGVTKLVKEARLTQDPDEEVEVLALSFQGGESVKILHDVQDGVVVPADYDSLVLLSYYSHLEDSADFFAGLGMNVDAILPITSHVAPELGFVSDISFTDNAAYLPTEHVFFVLEAFLFRDNVPLGANDGVITHEFSHAVFHYTLNKDNPNPRLPKEFDESLGWPDATRRWLSSLNEGLADVFALMRTTEPDFIAISIPAIEDDRDPRVVRDFTQEMLDNIEIDPVEGEEDETPFSPYDMGAVLASAMWRIADDPNNGLGYPRTAQIAYDALDALRNDNTYTGGNFRASGYFNLVVQAATPAEEAWICQVFNDQFSLISAELTQCP